MRERNVDAVAGVLLLGADVWCVDINIRILFDDWVTRARLEQVHVVPALRHVDRLHRSHLRSGLSPVPILLQCVFSGEIMK